MLERHLEGAREFCENLSVELSPVPSLPLNLLDNDISLYAMPLRYLWRSTVYISTNATSFPVAGSLKGELVCSGDVDIQNGVVISRTAKFNELSSVNVGSSKLTATAATVNSLYVRVSLDGTVKFAWTEPKTNLRYTATVYGPFKITTIEPQRYINY